MIWNAPNLPADKHGFFGREGGFSQGIYDSLNFNFKSDDARENLQKNMEIVTARFNLKPQNLLLLNQGTTNRVEYVDRPGFFELTADGAVTDHPGIILSIRTADCAPVLLADYESGVIGAAHAGWRGAFQGVIENCVSLMESRGASRLRIAAAVGPCIGAASYEVDESFRESFITLSPANNIFFSPGRPGHFYFDLEAFCRARLLACGIENICLSGQDTFAQEDRYFSFRRNTLRGLIRAPQCFPTEISTITL